MATRREFLVTTLAAGALPQALMASSRDPGASFKVICETLCPDGNAFARFHGAAATTLEHDPAALLFALEAGLAAGTTGVIAGLTRPSTRFLIEQCAARYGCFSGYYAHHRYTPGMLVHELHAPSAVNAILARRLLRTPQNWACTLAGSCDVLAETGGTPATLAFSVPVRENGESQHLVSWMLQRYPA